jgi:hypothetical protein
VTMKNRVFWDVDTCCSCTDRRFGDVYHFHHQGEKINWELGTLAVASNSSTLQLLVTVDVVPRSLILFNLMMEAICSSGLSVFCNNHRASHPRRRYSSK